MSNALEQLVRPFQAPNTLGTRRIVRSTTVTVADPVVVTWGEAGDLPVAVQVPPDEDPLDIGFEVKKRGTHNLTAMETEKVKITNPDDPEQFVITERIKKATFREKNADAVAAYPSSGSVTKTTPGQSDKWQPGETQVRIDGTAPGRDDPLHPLRITDRDYYITWVPIPNEEVVAGP